MASSRRLSNGRSPLVNQQRQITSFFSKSSISPSSSSPVVSKHKPELNPNPSPSTPSTSETKQKKPLLVIGHSPNGHIPTPNLDDVKTPDSGKAPYNEEVVGKRIKVYWPLDKSWYGGFVKSFDSLSGRHMVQYDDAEEEVLDLRKEKFEWVEEAKISLRRLRRLSASKKVVLDDGEKMEEGDGVVFDDNEGIEEGMGDDDDSADEDWGKNVGKDKLEDESEEMDLEDEEQDGLESLRQSRGRNVESKKRKTLEVEKQGSDKKSKSCRAGEKNVVKDSLVGSEGGLIEPLNNAEMIEPLNNAEKGKLSNIFYDTLKGDTAERFGLREAEKLWFLQDGHRDAERRRPGDADYDRRTLFLPHDFLKSLSGGQRQWWEFKSKHMDKVLFFKMGKFYELFEMDAHIGAKELNLQYMKGEQPHCGFPERNFSMNVEKLARKGYRVLVVEQTETPEQLEVRRKQKGSKDKVVKREICAVVTKGTLTEGEIFSANPDASYLMAVTENCCTLADDEKDLVFGVCVVDVSTSRFMLGQFEDDLECNVLCCLLSELRPVEIIKPAKLLSSETERTLLRHTRNPLFNDLVPLSEFWNADRTVREIQSMYKRIRDQSGIGNPDSYVEANDSGYLPDILNELVSAGENGSFALSALGGSLFYLRQAFLDETLLRFAKFEILPCSGLRDTPKRPYMVLDAAALENLEIFENSRDGSSTGTLYGQLNHCVTAFGKRLLKTWLARPLCHLGSIRERQDAVASLRGANLPFALEFRKEISRLPDMERLLARLFATSEANGRNANKVILYEDAAKKQLQEFIAALRGCELIAQASCSLQALLDNTDSSLLQYLLSPGKGFPEIHSILEDFKGAFDWLEADHSGRIIPREGVDKEYDSACKVVKDIEIGLTKYLKEQRKLLNDASINYVTVGKELYLLEVPESLRAKVPRDYELRSSKKGFFRYWTPHIKEQLGELSQAESEKESKLKSILQRLIGRFCEHHIKWRQLVSATAELDVLISLAIASDYYEGPTCRPIISDLSHSSELPHFSAKSLGHPILRSDALGKGSFVPNDVIIGGSGKASLILLTGPNMGGKSTLLRQVCMSVILAQLGADVPAERFELSLVDRIFVRMGAKDHIMAGQSTFLTELSETASMLSLATCNSLVALDELGRGTSTSDGQAIAESVVEHFVRKVQCRGIFSTHYHRLAVGYQKDSKVSLCHMACQVGGVDGLEEVTFLYRLTPGACPKSYGVNVARLAGLPDSLLQKAAAKSREFEAVYGKQRKGDEIECSNQRWDAEMVVFIQELVHATTNSNCHGNSNGMGIGLLVELQHRAKLLLQEGK